MLTFRAVAGVLPDNILENENPKQSFFSSLLTPFRVETF